MASYSSTQTSGIYLGRRCDLRRYVLLMLMMMMVYFPLVQNNNPCMKGYMCCARTNRHLRRMYVFWLCCYTPIDIQGPTDWTVFPPTSTHECATPSRLRSLYHEQRNVKGYRELLQQNVTIFGTFDGECWVWCNAFHVVFCIEAATT